MSHLIPLSERDFKTLAKQYLNTLREQTPADREPPTLMQAQELLARACGHQSLHEAKTWWATNAQPQPAIEKNTPNTYDQAAAMADTANVERLRNLLFKSASKLALYAGTFDRHKLLHEARSSGEINGTEHYTAHHIAEDLIKDGTLVQHDNLLTTFLWMEDARRLRKLSNVKNADLQVSLAPEHVFVGLSTEQTEAVANACKGQVASLLETHNGAGKTIMMEQVCKAHTEAGYDVIVSALSWKDTHIASYLMGQNSKAGIAIDPLLSQLHSNDSSGRPTFAKPTLVVLDNAGQVPVTLLSKLLDAADRDMATFKVFLVADKMQPYSAAAIVKEEIGSIQVHKDRRKPGEEGLDMTSELADARRPRMK